MGKSDKASIASAYPRVGCRLLPLILIPYFGYQALPAGLPPKRFGQLADLDERVWQECSNEEIKQLSHHVIKVITAGWRTLTRANERIFTTPKPISALGLSPRARNALCRKGLLHDGAIHGVLLRDVVTTRSLGAKTLLELLVADEMQIPLGKSVAEAPDLFPSTDLNPNRVDHEMAHKHQARVSRVVRHEASKLAKRPWASLLTRRDPRVGSALRALVGRGSTAKEIAEALPGYAYEPSAARRKAALIRSLVVQGDRLSRLTVDEELEQILAAGTTSERQRLALRRRFGWGRNVPATLEIAAQEIAVTRERVRQLESAFRKRVSNAWTPALDRALRIVRQMSSASEPEIAQELEDAGIVSRRFPLASVIQAAHFFGRDVGAVTVHGGRVSNPEVGRVRAQVRLHARRLTERWGATTVAELVSVLAETGKPVNEVVVRKVLDSSGGIEFLDADREWLWVRGVKRNRLLNYARKILAVAGSIEVGELRDGVGRHHRMKGFRPPRDVLLRLCAASGEYTVDGERVVAKSGFPDWHEVLSGNEQIIAEILFEQGPVMRRSDLEELVVGQHGMNRSSFYIYLTFSPILERYARGVFGLRGAPISGAQVSAMIPPTTYHRVVQDHGWTDDRHVWIVYRLSPAGANTGVLTVPSALAPVLHGQFALAADDGTPMGTLVVDGSSLWGVSPFFRRRGIEAGDYLALELDPAERTARIKVGSEDLVTQYRGDD